MSIVSRIEEYLDRRKFGEIRQTYAITPHRIHVAGPVMPYMQTMHPNESEKQINHRLANARFDPGLASRYLGGEEFVDGQHRPLSESLFLLRIDRDCLNDIISIVTGLDQVHMQGQLLPLQASKPRPAVQPTSQSQAKYEATRYLQDLVYWELHCFDYSDYVHITAERREKNGTTNLVIRRNWSRANKGYEGWRVVEKGKEKVIISGRGYKDGLEPAPVLERALHS